MSENAMTVWGFWVTVAGTVFGFFSLILAAYISVNTKKIKSNLTNKHLQEKYKKSKTTIVIDLITSYKLLKEDDILDDKNIDESIISLKIYEGILTKQTKRKLKDLGKKVDNDTINNTFTGKKEIRKLLYELIERLVNELDENEEFLKEVTK